MSAGDLTECCISLESDKVSERKKYCTKLSSLLENQDVVNILNNGRNTSWKELIKSLQKCLRKDAEKAIEDAKKKGTSSGISANCLSADLFVQVVNFAVREEIYLNITELVGYLVGCMDDLKMKRCYEKEFLVVLQKYILSNSRCRGKLDTEDWAALYNMLKKLLEEYNENTVVTNCFKHLIKYGPICGLSPMLLREEFNFLTKTCQRLTRRSTRTLQEDTIEIALDFCKHTAKDNRVSCCKFGEDIFMTLKDLYESNGKPEKTKELLVQFFLFQMIIHHPNGVPEGHSAAYAYNWDSWKKMIKSMYSLIGKEIDFYFKSWQKNSSFFKIEAEKTTLCPNFSRLFVEISKQMFNYPDLDVSMALDCSFATEKRQKCDFTLMTFIDMIQHTKSWLWIHLVCSIIKRYPDVVEIDDYAALLKILSNMQIENNEHNVINELYFCLSAMVQMENSLDPLHHKEKIDNLWTLIGGSTTRAFGLNQHKDATENLLEKLIGRGITDFEDVLQTYQSGVISLSLQSIKTFNAGLRYMVLNKDLRKKERIMKCILTSQNLKNYKYICSKETATLLVKLMLKQWQSDDQNVDNANNEISEYDNLKHIYLKSLLDEATLTPKNINKTEDVKNAQDVDPESAAALVEVVKDFITDGPDTAEILFSKIILLINLASCIVEYQILPEDECNNSTFMQLLEELFNKDTIKNFTLGQFKCEKEVKRIIECVDVLNTLFSLKISKWAMTKLKELLPFSLLKELFRILNSLQNSQKRVTSLYSNLKIVITQALSSFGCVFGNNLNQNQKHILEVLTLPNYNFNMDEDYKLVKVFLKTISLAEPGVFPNAIIEKILKCFQELCAERYRDKAEDMLNILRGLFPHVAATGSMENKSQTVAILKPFYINIKMNGPDVAIALLNCIEVLCELDPHSNFSRWSDTEIIRIVPEFLRSDYQEVRLKTIEVLVTYYTNNSNSNIIRDIHRQEEMFLKIFEASGAVFDVAGITTDERRADEVVARTSSVLLTFGEIATNCDNFIEESIYALIKIAHIKKMDSLDRMFSIINKRKGGTKTNILEKYILYLVERWLNDSFTFDDFPYSLLNCSTKFDFYKKYFEECAPLLIVTEQDDIVKVAQELLGTDKKMVEKISATIFSRAICTDLDNATHDVLTKNQSLFHYSKIITYAPLKDILGDNLDQIVTGILDFLTDEEDMKSYFGETVIYFSKHLNATDVKDCIAFIETFLCDGQPLGLFLTDMRLPQFEHVLLQLKSNIYKTQVIKDMLKYFHRYAFFVCIITTSLKRTSRWGHFFIRDVIHSLFNVIENNEGCHSMVAAASRFLNTFLRKILPNLAATFKAFFHDTISSLKKYYVTRETIKEACKQLLIFLIVENMNDFKEEIKKLDTFPDHSDFREVRLVQKNIRYGSGVPLLEDEIHQFLNHQDILTKEDSLVHLRKILASQKDELMEFYDKLQDIRGFSEDCENSLLHRLVCALSQLSYSTNQNVSFEAARCLGEIGPANLQTLVLQPEKNLIHAKHSPFEIISGTAISLFMKYIIDCDINVIQKVSKMLYLVLDSKEGRKIADQNTDFGYGPINKNYIIPYYPSHVSSPSHSAVVNIDLFITRLDNDDLWCPQEGNNHSSWITLLISNLLEPFTEKSFLNKLIDVCNVKVDFSEYILPLVIYLLLSLCNRTITNLLSKSIDYFFSIHWTLTVQLSSKEETIALNKKSVKCMLNVVNYVRLMKKCSVYKTRTADELTLNYLKVAKAAQFCANHFAALYYSELWCQQIIEKIQRENITYCEERSTMIDFIYENEEEFGETLHNILRNAYKAIGDFDALPGCGISFLLLPKYRVEHYKEQKKFDQVIQFYANQTSQAGLSSKQLMDSFKNCGLYQIPVFCSQLEEPEYECLWRLGQWDFEEKRRSFHRNVASYEDFEKYRFCTLKALHDRNQFVFEESSKSQCLCVINHIKNISLESTHNVYPILTQLQSLVEIEDFYAGSKSKNFAALFGKWKLQDVLIKKNAFQYVEPIIAQRLIMLKNYLEQHDDENVVREYIIDLNLDFANWAKDEGHFQEGSAILEGLKRIPGMHTEAITKMDLLDAQLSWSLGNTHVARQILNRLCKNNEISPKLKSAALKLTGQYKSETNSENRTTIISEYFLASVQLMGSVKRDAEDIKCIMDTYDKLAIFADREYVQIMTYMKSDLFQKKITNMEQAKKTASSIQKQRKKTYEENKAAAIHDRNSNIDELEIKSTKQERNQFLKLAMKNSHIDELEIKDINRESNQILKVAVKYYLLCLVHSDDKNIRIFRIMSLFLDNRKNNEITDTINEHLHKLPSYKYIIMLPQLIPHLSLDNDTDLFSKSVNDIIEKCAVEHPHHTLPLLLALANAHKDRAFEESTTKTSTNDGRITTAKDLLTKLKSKGLRNQIDKLHEVSVALIHLAYFKGQDEGNERKKEFTITKNEKIMKIKDFAEVLVPTYDLAVSIKNKYPQIVGIASFKSTYEIVGGVNKPKKIMCRGTDGNYYSQLVKGQDDLRQDAVMQQVFSIMNNLLSLNKSTQHLLIRRYKIVPLSMRSGILKWADDSMPIGEYLTGGQDTKGAHQIYRPDDKLPSSCRDLFKKCAGKTADVKLKTYKEICKSFKPVFHHFFESFFPQPAVWYERRRAFIHSVATTSMCGYILGIGDRHTSNILIDKTTAEVIHIDFGIAFEQGRVLPTPETVPFRLTRDMVDAMGVSGVEGIFRRSCEKTMEVLRQNAQTIITILEVLLYDPLYAWTVTSAEANKRQTDSDLTVRTESSDSSEESVNVSAERALLRLREKLQGTELGHPRSIEQQVGTLIQQAVDPANLCKLFVGWQPYV